MNESLGIDHALVCVKDIARARDTYLGLGFLSRGFSQHPWGTSTTVLIFRDQLFEIVGIGDAELLDGYEAGGFQFGRHVEQYLAEREGVCLTALNSTDAAQDERELTARGVAVTGTIDFGRRVTLEDGTPDQTRTQLKVMVNPDFPRLSLFACQQFRRDLIEYPEWMAHPNGVHRIACLTVLCAAEDVAPVTAWFEKVHGVAARQTVRGTRVQTANGAWTITDREGFAALYGAVPDEINSRTMPTVAGIDLVTPTPDKIAEAAATLGLSARSVGDLLVLPEAARLGGVCLRFGAFDD